MPIASPSPPESVLPDAIVLVGPTASGKSQLAMDLVDGFAGRCSFEVVSVDSAQVFIGMDIGTAKPDRATQARLPHHLIDLVTPEASYSAGRFVADATRTMQEIRARGAVPLLVGGTMLYIKALLEGIADLPPADPALRAAIESDAVARGWPALHAELAALDPAAAARIDPMHSHRIQRALELVRLTGKPLDALYEAGRPTRPPGNFLQLALVPDDRVRLHGRIAERFRAMLAAGLVEEVAGLRRRHELRPEMTSMRCVGYRQVMEMQDGLTTPAEMEDKGIAATRQLAKRQMTWLRSLPGFSRFDPFAADTPRRLAECIRSRCDL